MARLKSALSALQAMNAQARLHHLPLAQLVTLKQEKAQELAKYVLQTKRAPSLIRILMTAPPVTNPPVERLLAQRPTQHQPAQQVSSPTQSLTAAWIAPSASSAQLCMPHLFPALRATMLMSSILSTAQGAQLALSALPLMQSHLVIQATTPWLAVLTATLFPLVWLRTSPILSLLGPLSVLLMKFQLSFRKTAPLARKIRCVEHTTLPKKTAMVTE